MLNNIEEAKKILVKFKDNEMQRDKLERDNRCGGWKIGDVYKHLELNISIETVLQALDNSISKDKVKEKIGKIDLKINNFKIEINKTLREIEEAGTETEIDTNEQYLEHLEIELERLEITKRILKELLEDK